MFQGVDLAKFDHRRTAFLAALAGALATGPRSIHVHEVGREGRGSIIVKFKVLTGVVQAQTIASHARSHAFNRKVSAGLQSHGVRVLPSGIVAGEASIVHNLRENQFASESFFLRKQKAVKPQRVQQPSPSSVAIILSSPSLIGMSFLVVALFCLLVAQLMQLRDSTLQDGDI